MSMPAWAYHAGPNGLWIFLIVTVILGGLAAFATGRALAQTWRPVWMVPLATALLTCAVRFIHYAVFGEVLLSTLNFVVDMLVVTASALLAYRRARTEQMAEQYPWLTAAACPVEPVTAPAG